MYGVIGKVCEMEEERFVDNIKYVYCDWKKVDNIVKELVRQIRGAGKNYDGVYGVPRGGLLLAVMLSHRLDLPMLLFPTKDSLVCDDISDTGVTLENLKCKSIACMYKTQWSSVLPEFYVESKTDVSSWIVYPWEVQ